MALTKITSRILDSSGVTTVGTISTGVWQGTAINQTYLVGQSGTNTGDETLARINALDITELGTISSGVWNGTAIDQTYLVGQSGTNTGDQTTISGNAGTVTNGVYTVGNQTIAGVKTFSSAVNLTSADDTRLKLTDTGNSSELIFRSDGANTQIYTNTAHDLGIYTANNVGQIHLKQSTGNVGIGTNSPSSKLHIRTSTNFNYEFEEVSSKLRLSALNDARSANVPLQFAASEFNFITGNVTIGTTAPQDFYLALRGGVGGFFGWDDSANKTIVQAPNTRALSFQVNSDTFGSGTEALAISSGGMATFSGVVNIPVGAVAAPSLIFAGDSDSGMWHPAANTLAFSTFGSERLRISSAGLVGIGTNSPATELQIGDYTDATQAITIATTQNGTGRINFYDNNDTEGGIIKVTGKSGGSTMTFAGRWNVDNPKVTFDLVNGNVGIGTTSPVGLGGNAKALVVTATSNYPEVIVERLSTGAGKWGMLIGNDSTLLFRNYVSGGNVLCISNSDKVGIGTASPAGKLSIVSSGGTDGLRINAGTSSSNNGLVVNNEADNATLFYVRGNGDSAVGGNFTVNNKFSQNSVGRRCNSGYATGNASFYVDYTVTVMSSLKVTAVFNHYGYITTYGCARFSLVGLGQQITAIDISTTTSGNGGSWSISRIDNTTLRVSKNAGTYQGAGHWFIEVIGAEVS